MEVLRSSPLCCSGTHLHPRPVHLCGGRGGCFESDHPAWFHPCVLGELSSEDLRPNWGQPGDGRRYRTYIQYAHTSILMKSSRVVGPLRDCRFESTQESVSLVLCRKGQEAPADRSRRQRPSGAPERIRFDLCLHCMYMVAESRGRDIA